MRKLTIFTIPKAFNRPVRTLQLNAIGSWLQLKPACEVLLFGNDDGTAEVASQLGVKHVPEIECSDQGTPLVSSAFHLARQLSDSELFAYVNADVMLVSDFVRSLARLEDDSFLVVGRRYNVDVRKPVDFGDPSWEPSLLEHVRRTGVLFRPQGLDYFVFPRGLFQEMPPFVVGRAMWDNWMVLHARLSGIPVIDATKAITAIHQNHDYSHLAKGESTMRYGTEAQHNWRLLGNRSRAFDVRDATHMLTAAGVRPATDPARRLRRLVKTPELHPHHHPIVDIVLAGRALLNIAARVKRRLTEQSDT